MMAKQTVTILSWTAVWQHVEQHAAMYCGFCGNSKPTERYKEEAVPQESKWKLRLYPNSFDFNNLEYVNPKPR